jgi:pilus assembly protein CpaC
MGMMRLWLFLFLLFVPVVSMADSQSGVVTRADDIQRQDPLLVMTVGKAEIVDIQGPVSDIMVADPDVVDVVALQSKRLYMVGSKVGNTNVIALDAAGNIIVRLNVHVRVDERTLEETIHDLFPKEDITAKTVNDQVILVGQASSPTVIAQIQDLAVRFVGDEKKLLNLVKVNGQMQVMLKVRVMEASRGVLKEFGIETSANDLTDVQNPPLLFNQRYPNSIGGGAGGNMFTNGQTGLTSDPFGIGRIFYDTGINGIGMTEILFNALEQDNMVHVLAEPNLTAISGEEANFLAGGEFPVPTGRDTNGNIVIEFKPFGVSLNFKPRVLGDDRISMQLKTEVSSLDQDSGITIDEIVVPGLDVRRAETVVELNSGGSLMIAGLLKSETVKGLSGLPGVRNTPILGDLISSDSFNRQETELLIVVTPYVVEPIARADDGKGLKGDGKGKTAASDSTDGNAPLQQAFRQNLERVYGDRLPQTVNEIGKSGYILE